jgi:hypothetical protein
MARRQRSEADSTPVAVALVCLTLACVVFFSSLIPALHEERVVEERLRRAERTQRLLQLGIDEDRRILDGLREDPQELLRALDEAGIPPPTLPAVRDPRDERGGSRAGAPDRR